MILLERENAFYHPIRMHYNTHGQSGRTRYGQPVRIGPDEQGKIE